MTLLEMKKLFRAYVNDQGSDRWPDSGDVNPTTLINKGQIAVRGKIETLDEKFFSKGQDYTVAASMDSYEFPLPADFETVMHAERLVPGQRPVKAAWTSFPMRHIDESNEPWQPGGNLAPLLYLRGLKIGVVGPREGFTLRLWYTKAIPDLVADTDISEIPLKLHELVVLCAAKRAYHSEGRTLGEWAGEYKQQLEDLVEFIDSRQRAEPQYVNVIEG